MTMYMSKSLTDSGFTDHDIRLFPLTLALWRSAWLVVPRPTQDPVLSTTWVEKRRVSRNTTRILKPGRVGRVQCGSLI